MNVCLASSLASSQYMDPGSPSPCGVDIVANSHGQVESFSKIPQMSGRGLTTNKPTF